MSKLAALTAAFANQSKGNHRPFFAFWKIPENSTCTVRFLPDLDDENPLGFLVENLEHELMIGGEKKHIPCLTMYKEPCAICQLSRDYYAEKNETAGKRYYRKKAYIGQVIVIDSPIPHNAEQLVKLIEFGPAIFKTIQSGFQGGDLECEPYALKGGYHFRIRKTRSGEYASYSTSSFAPKQSDLDTDVINELKLFNLADQRATRIPAESVQAMLLAERTGTAVQEAVTNYNPPVTTAVPLNESAAKSLDLAKIEANLSDKTKSLVDQFRQRMNEPKA